jgi:hypothetical protein
MRPGVSAGEMPDQPLGATSERALRQHDSSRPEPQAVPISGVGELLVGVDRMPLQDVGPGFQPGAGKIPVDPADARLAELGDLLEQAWRDARRGVVGIDQDGEPGQAVVCGYGRNLRPMVNTWNASFPV